LDLSVEGKEGIMSSVVVEETIIVALGLAFIVSEEFVFVRVFISEEVSSGIVSSKRMSSYSIRDCTIL
jgi:hypothetical protein